MNTYLIKTSNDTYTYNAENLYDLIIQHMKYIGEYSHLFEKAFEGCKDNKDMIDMANHFIGYCHETIEKIYRVEEIFTSNE